MLKQLSIIFSITFAVIACSEKENECDLVNPILPSVSFTIVNQQGLTLVGDSNVYHPDSIFVIYNNRPLTVSNTDSILRFNFEVGNTVDDYLLLTNNELDTIRLTYYTEQGKCFNTYIANTFLLNNIPQNKIKNTFIIRK